MDNKQIFDQYKKRLVLEGVLKSSVCGFAAGFGVDFVIALISWIVGFDGGLWLAIGLGLGVAVTLGVVLYFVRFKPTDVQVARRIDGMGLDERMITMHDFKNDESYIADVQRKDAVAGMARAHAAGATIKISTSTASIIVAAVLAVLGIAMSIVAGLSSSGVIPRAEEIVPPGERETYYEVLYIIEEGGYIEGGDEAQLVKAGEDAEPVIAVEEDGWMFEKWSDGVTNPARWDVKIDGDFEVTAEFVRVEPSDDDDQGQGDGEGDSAPDEPQEGDENGDQQDPNQPNPGTSAGGIYEQGDKIKDGETYYKDVFDSYYQEAMDKLANGEDLPSYLREFVELYFNGLK